MSCRKCGYSFSMKDVVTFCNSCPAAYCENCYMLNIFPQPQHPIEESGIGFSTCVNCDNTSKLNIQWYWMNKKAS